MGGVFDSSTLPRYFHFSSYEWLGCNTLLSTYDSFVILEKGVFKMSDNDITLFGKKLVYYDRFFGTHKWAFLACGLIGLVISKVCRLTLNNGAWSSFLGLIVQIFVAFITVIIVFYIARITFILMNFHDNIQSKTVLENVQTAKDDTLFMLSNIIPIIIVSVILMPLGGLEIENESILKIWNTLKLDWFFIFGIIGFSFSTLYKILEYMQKLLKMSFNQNNDES